MAKSPSAGAKKRRKKPPEPTGLLPSETLASPPRKVEELRDEISGDGGAVLAVYREPLGGKWVILAALPIEQLEPTPYQRGLSDAHVKRLTDVIGRTGRYLDPVIAVRVGEKKYQTPNGNHRLNALKQLGARAITALVVTEPELARLILALNCEKAHNLREKCSEVIKLARELAPLPGMKEKDYSLEFEEPSLLTLGMCYEARPRFAGGAYHPLLKRVDAFSDRPLLRSLEAREAQVKTLLEIDDRVAEVVAELKSRGFESPYLKSFVVARCNPLRFRPGVTMAIEDALDKMLQQARRLDTSKIKVTDVARSGGPPAEEGGS
ncbi:MAG TPA: ParB N-terminal domain-containing protein [Planctomycetota bacterium]|jgi:ParB family chromosome partitioning protein|nr:ParB N-terminal domain-containing protein [Planctomycetota bacterium]